MRKSVAAFSGTGVLAAAGFAAATVLTSGSLAAALTTTTGSTSSVGTTTTAPTGTTSVAAKRVTICHVTGSKKQPLRTIVVSSNAVAVHLRRGGHLGPCLTTETLKQAGGKPLAPKPAVTTTAATTSVAEPAAGKRDKPEAAVKADKAGHGNSGHSK